MAHETLTLQDSSLEVERLLGAAAFGSTIDMSDFELQFTPDETVTMFDSLIDPGEPSVSADSYFNSYI